MATGAEIAASIVKLAGTKVGIHEEPMGSNRGPEIDVWLTDVGAQPGEPWCAAFATSVARAAGCLHGPFTASSGAVAAWGKAHNAVIDPPNVVPGCIGAVRGDSPTGHVHTVICVSDGHTDGWCLTIEGNEGNSVVRHSRAVCTVDWVLPWKLDAVD